MPYRQLPNEFGNKTKLLGTFITIVYWNDIECKNSFMTDLNSGK